VVKDGRRLRLKISPPSLSRFYGKCGNLDISQLCRSPRPVTGIALLPICRRCLYLTGNKHTYLHGLLRGSVAFYMYISYLTRDTPMGLHGLIRGCFLYLYVDGRRPLWSSSQSSWLLTQRSWLLTQRSWIRFPALPDFLSSSGSVTGFTQPL
jgi:hypothetical protein